MSPDAQAIFGRPKTPSPHDSPSFAPPASVVTPTGVDPALAEEVGAAEVSALVSDGAGVGEATGACGAGEDPQPMIASTTVSNITSATRAIFMCTSIK